MQPAPIVVGGGGRLGNQIIRGLAVSLVAEKHNLRVDYRHKDSISPLGIDLFSGTETYNRTNPLTDDNYFTIYNRGNLNCNLDPNRNFFQTKKICNLLYNYLHTDTIKSKIIGTNRFSKRYNANNDLFVHVRLGDIAIKNLHTGIRYYMKTIKAIDYENLYISSDSPSHAIIKALIQEYPNANLVKYDETTTVQFASTCKHVVLSHGSFSAVIGYLSFFSAVYYPEYEADKMWYGNMFSINKWVKCSVA